MDGCVHICYDIVFGDTDWQARTIQLVPRQLNREVVIGNADRKWLYNSAVLGDAEGVAFW